MNDVTSNLRIILAVHAGSKTLSLLLIFAIAASQLLFSCQAVMAGLLPSKAASPHSCCQHNEPKPAEPDRTCPHCNGTALVTSAVMFDPPATVVIDLVALPMEFSPIVLLPCTLVTRSAVSNPANLLPAITLFGLHCAQLT